MRCKGAIASDLETIARIVGAKADMTPLPSPCAHSRRWRLPIRRIPELAEIEGDAQQGPLALDLAEPAQQELPKSQGACLSWPKTGSVVVIRER